MKKYLKYGIMGLIAVALSAILFKPQPKEVLPTSPRSYEEIIQSDTLRAVTEYNSISFHVKEDTIDGLHYAVRYWSNGNRPEKTTASTSKVCWNWLTRPFM